MCVCWGVFVGELCVGVFVCEGICVYVCVSGEGCFLCVWECLCVDGRVSKQAIL